MAERKFVVVPLEEKQAGKVAQAISNKTSRKILDFLSKNDATESELASELGLPLSTVHYNLQALLLAELVWKKSFKYSAKGKKVFRFAVADKSIVIAPRGVSVLKRELRRVIPAALVSGVGAVFVRVIWGFIGQPVVIQGDKVFGVERAAETMSEAGQAVGQSMATNYALFFVVGAAFALLVYLLLNIKKFRGGEK